MDMEEKKTGLGFSAPLPVLTLQLKYLGLQVSSLHSWTDHYVPIFGLASRRTTPALPVASVEQSTLHQHRSSYQPTC